MQYNKSCGGGSGTGMNPVVCFQHSTGRTQSANRPVPDSAMQYSTRETTRHSTEQNK